MSGSAPRVAPPAPRTTVLESDIVELKGPSTGSVLSLVEEASAQASRIDHREVVPPRPVRRSWAAQLAPRLASESGARLAKKRAQAAATLAACKEALRTAFQEEADADSFLARARKETQQAQRNDRLARAAAKEQAAHAKLLVAIAEKAERQARLERERADCAHRELEVALGLVSEAEESAAAALSWEQEARAILKRARATREAAQTQVDGYGGR